MNMGIERKASSWSRARVILLVVGLSAAWAAGVGIRRAVLSEQERQWGADMPFTLESALFFRRIRTVEETGRMPEHDVALQAPEGVRTAEVDTVGIEPLFARLQRLLPDAWPMEARCRWVALLWFSLSIPLIGLWIAAETGSVWAAWLTAAWYAVSAAAVMRSTGQELQHENVALPLLLGHLALDALARRTAAHRLFLGAAAGSALLLALALASWDLVQYYLALLLVAGIVRAVREKPDDAARGTTIWAALCVALTATAWLNPYYRAHGFWTSPVLFGFWGVLASRFVARAWPVPSRRVLRIAHAACLTLIVLGPMLLAVGLGARYGSSYAHFADLLWAKLRFLNSKPDDPGLLTFTQRIMWTPSLHSATGPMTAALFPLMGPLTFVAILLGCLRRKAVVQAFWRVAFFCSVSWLFYILFVRFHVFVALFSAALFGLWAAGTKNRSFLVRLLVGVVLSFAVMGEAYWVLAHAAAWGRSNVYYRELRELTEWMRVNGNGEPVLANFGVSASILAYGDCPVVLHPKFENEALRGKVRAYAETLFGDSETAFRDLAEGWGARWYVYAMGEFSSRSPELQMRYMVNALNPPETAPARSFEFAPHALTRFDRTWGNRKYRVFRIRTKADERRAEAFADEARTELEHGRLDRAEAAAFEALALDPRQAEALDVIRTTGALREQGFAYPEADAH